MEGEVWKGSLSFCPPNGLLDVGQIWQELRPLAECSHRPTTAVGSYILDLKCTYIIQIEIFFRLYLSGLKIIFVVYTHVGKK